MEPALIFIAVAVAIVAIALITAAYFRARRKPKSDPTDLNANPRDGDAIATWSGIDEAENS